MPAGQPQSPGFSLLACTRDAARVMKCQQDDGTTVAWPTDTASHAKQASSKNSCIKQGVSP